MREFTTSPLLWRHNGRDGVSNHQPHHCLPKRFIQAQIKVNIKAPRHWPLCGEFTGDRWIPRTNGQSRGKCFHPTTSSLKTHLGSSPCVVKHPRAPCEWNVPVTGYFPLKGPVLRNFGFLRCLPEQAVEQSSNCQWFETPWCSSEVTVILRIHPCSKVMRIVVCNIKSHSN